MIFTCTDIHCPPMPTLCFKNAAKKGYLQAVIVSEQGWCSLQWGKTCGLPPAADDLYELEEAAENDMRVTLEANGDRIELWKGKYENNTLLALWAGRRKEREELHITIEC